MVILSPQTAHKGHYLAVSWLAMQPRLISTNEDGRVGTGFIRIFEPEWGMGFFSGESLIYEPHYDRNQEVYIKKYHYALKAKVLHSFGECKICPICVRQDDIVEVA